MITTTITTTVRCDSMVDGFLCVSVAEMDCGKKYAKRRMTTEGWKFKAGGKAICPKCNGKKEP
jgi:hypothetical protein